MTEYQLAHQFEYKGEHLEKLLKYCEYSKELYNQANDLINNKIIKINYNKLDNYFKNLQDDNNPYRKLKTQLSQQTLILLAKNWKSFFASMREWKINPEKFKSKPRPPKNKTNKYNLLTYTNQACTIKGEFLQLEKGISIRIPQFDKKLISFNQIRILPFEEYVRFEIVYEVKKEQIEDLDYSLYSSIDLGVNNLVSMIFPNNKPLIFSGEIIKSYNAFFNKDLSRLKAKLQKCNNKKTSRKIKNKYHNRENFIKDYFHKISKTIVNILMEKKIGNLVVGYNLEWKQEIKLGKKNNQKFSYIPFLMFIKQLEYKCQLSGINLILHEESYTSKVDSLALEGLYKQENYLGKRIKRGLFQSSTGKFINADINGAINILRKVVGDSSSLLNEIINSGLWTRPVIIRNIYNYKENLIIINNS